MIHFQHFVRSRSFENLIVFPAKINSFIIAHFASAILEWKKRKPYDILTLDFSDVQKPYSNGMLAIIATISNLKTKGHHFEVRLPNDSNVRKLFRSTNWAYFLDPKFPKSESIHDRHLVTRKFNDYKDIPVITNDFMDVVLRNMPIPKDIVSALEWSIYEICDNVINHSESAAGGFVEVVTYSKEDLISFTVADAGRGILNSLQEGIPTLRTDAQAIGEAIKAGVTRNKDVGQGNGLAGTLRITTMTNGAIDITSGAGRFYSTCHENKTTEAEKNQLFKGTSVSGQIRMNKKFSIGKALDFNGTRYTPLNIIDLQYEMSDQDCLLIKISNETTGVGTRKAGKQLKTKMINLIESKPGYPIYVDWSGIPVISSSFADEFMGKIFVELGPLSFSAIIRNKNMEPLIKELLDKAISQRMNQENKRIFTF